MKQFNLEKALLGESVTTVDEREVTQLHLFQQVGDVSPFVLGAFVEGKGVVLYTIDGRYDLTRKTPYDLVMKDVDKECWVNIYKKVDGTLMLSREFSSEVEAIEIGRIYKDKLMKTIKIEK